MYCTEAQTCCTGCKWSDDFAMPSGLWFRIINEKERICQPDFVATGPFTDTDSGWSKPGEVYMVSRNKRCEAAEWLAQDCFGLLYLGDTWKNMMEDGVSWSTWWSHPSTNLAHVNTDFLYKAIVSWRLSSGAVATKQIWQHAPTAPCLAFSVCNI